MRITIEDVRLHHNFFNVREMTQKLPQQDMIVTTSSQMMVMMSSLLKMFKMLKLTIIFKMITLPNRNPCGAGVRPTTCTCADGTTITK